MVDFKISAITILVWNIILQNLVMTMSEKFLPCPDAPNTGILNGAVVSNCTSQEKCIVQAGTTIPLGVDFTTSEASATLEVDTYGIFPGFPVPMPLLGYDTNGCNVSYNIRCPLSSNIRYRYSSTITIPRQFLPTDLQGKVRLKDVNKKTIVCFMVDARIVRSVTIF